MNQGVPRKFCSISGGVTGTRFDGLPGMVDTDDAASQRLDVTKKYTPGRALRELAAQHDALRGMMDRCMDLADELDAGQIGPAQLTREAARLRLAFEAHNRFEEQLLRPVLEEADAFAEVRIERMIEDHIGEHRAMHARLGSTQTSELRDVIETLRAHLEAEERYLLSARVLRDDVVTIEGGG